MFDVDVLVFRFWKELDNFSHTTAGKVILPRVLRYKICDRWDAELGVDDDTEQFSA